MFLAGILIKLKALRKFESGLNLFQVKIFGFFNTVTYFSFYYYYFFLRSRRFFFLVVNCSHCKKTVLFIFVFLVERLSYFCIYLWYVETLFVLTENTFREN